MSINDWKDYQDNESTGSEIPVVGNSVYTTPPGQLRVHYLMANVNIESERFELERIANAALVCGGMLNKPGDVFIIKEETHFDREGNYIVAFKYMERVPEVPDVVPPGPQVTTEPTEDETGPLDNETDPIDDDTDSPIGGLGFTLDGTIAESNLDDLDDDEGVTVYDGQ